MKCKQNEIEWGRNHKIGSLILWFSGDYMRDRAKGWDGMVEMGVVFYINRLNYWCSLGIDDSTYQFTFYP